MTPIILRRLDLANETVSVLNRFARRIGRQSKAYVITVREQYRPVRHQLFHPEVERAEVTAILRLLILGYRNDEITPIMVTQEQNNPSLGAQRI